MIFHISSIKIERHSSYSNPSGYQTQFCWTSMDSIRNWTSTNLQKRTKLYKIQNVVNSRQISWYARVSHHIELENLVMYNWSSADNFSEAVVPSASIIIVAIYGWLYRCVALIAIQCGILRLKNRKELWARKRDY